MNVLLAVEDERNIGPGFLGFTVLFLMAVAVYLLLRDMTRRLRRLRHTSDPAATDADPRPVPGPQPPAGEGQGGAPGTARESRDP